MWMKDDNGNWFMMEQKPIDCSGEAAGVWHKTEQSGWFNAGADASFAFAQPSAAK